MRPPAVVWQRYVFVLVVLVKSGKAASDGSGCDWVKVKGIDLFRGTQCDLATLRLASSPGEKDDVRIAACADACDAKEDGVCKAWTLLGQVCMLKSCTVEHKVHSAAAISALRRDDTQCGAIRNWPAEMAWLETWRAMYGNDTYLTHNRKPEDSIRFAPIVTVRGERHSGTNWVRALVDLNCKDLPFHLSPLLDEDGAYGWKHAMPPLNWSPNTKDIMIYILRSAATWLPKMRSASYNTELDRHRTKTLASFLEVPVFDPSDRARFGNVLEMRTKKYIEYRQLALECPGTVLALRYEDVLKDHGAFMIDALRARLPKECPFLSSNTTRPHDTNPIAKNASSFIQVSNYAKFGTVSPMTSGNSHDRISYPWSPSDWSALLYHLDAELETSLGYRYSLSSVGTFELIDPLLPTWLTLPPP